VHLDLDFLMFFELAYKTVEAVDLSALLHFNRLELAHGYHGCVAKQTRSALELLSTHKTYNLTLEHNRCDDVTCCCSLKKLFRIT